jgi:hypothetical protein
MAAGQAPPSKIALRVALERQRADFARLVDDISDTQWSQQGANTSWTNGDVLAHLLQDIDLLPRAIDHARRGKALLNYPAFIRDPINFLLVKRLARRHGRPSLKAAYNKAIDDAIAALDGVREDEWQLGANFFGAGFRDIERLFSAQAEHFADHVAALRAAIGQGTRAKPVEVRRRRGR